jgi:MFS transporter, PPP family, 3-phenylpropionic acid transporter
MSFFTRIKTFITSPTGRRINLWLSFFLFWGAIASFIPYLSLYYDSIGLSGTQIGTLNSVRAALSFISAIAIAFLSDVLRRRKLVFILAIFGMIILLAIFPYMASFITILPIIALYSALQTPNIAILDQETLSILKNPRDYSKIRVGGSFGVGVITLLTGLIVDRPGMPLTAIFYVHIALLILLLFLILALPDSQDQQQQGKIPSTRDITDLFHIPGFALWLGIIFLFGLGDAAMINFLFLHIRSIGGSASLMGLATVLSIAGEVAGYYLAQRVQRRVGSRRMITLAFIFRTFWFVLIALNRVPLLVLPIHILNGIGFALVSAGSVAYVNERAPAHIGTTAQGIRSAILIRLSGVVGSIIAGVIYQRSGSTRMYLIFAIFSVFSLLLAAILRRADRRREAKPNAN